EPHAVAPRPARESAGEVAAAAPDIEERAGLGGAEQGADDVAIGCSPARDDRIDVGKATVGAVEHPTIAVGVVHELGEMGRAPTQVVHHVAVKRPDSTVRPGPNAMAHTRSPGCADPRMCLSTNSTVALLILP